MKKKFSLSLLVIILITFFIIPYGVDKLKGIDKVVEEGNIRVVFCPQENCEKALIIAIKQATEIKCAFYDLNLKNLTKALLESKAEVLLFEEGSKNAPKSFTRIGSRSLMHNKFCVFDKRTIVTGSMNPTYNGAYKNNNNVLFIDSPTLASNYLEEFKELKSKIETKVDYPEVTLIVDNRSIRIENYFCPEDGCEKEILTELRAAKQTIKFMTFSFTSNPIGNLLLEQERAGISIQGVFEARQKSRYSEFEKLKKNGLDVQYDGSPQTMHHKVFIIDNQTIVTGSMNPTTNGNTRNDENILIIHDALIASQFLEEFTKVWAEANN